MKWIISCRLPVLLAFFALIYAGCSDKENASPEVLPPGEDNTEEIVPVSEAEFFQDTLFYYGTDNTVIISCQEQGTTYELEAFEGHVLVFFKEGVKPATAQNAIRSLNGTIIEQIPATGYYLVRVSAGKEVDFISKIAGNNVEYVCLDLVSVPYSLPTVSAVTHFMDASFPGELHGEQTQSVYDKCSGKVSYLHNFGYRRPNGKTGIRANDAINAIVKRYRSDELYNLSFGPALDPNNDRLQYAQANNIQRRSYVKAYQTQIKNLIRRLYELRRAGIRNIVVTMAAGNEGLANFDEVVLVPMLNGTAGSNSLSSTEQKILQENILIVSSLESTSNSMKYFNNAMGKVNTENLTYNGQKLRGTSFAAPQALCEIRKLMGEMGISAVAAMAAVKQAIRNNPSAELVYREALIQAQLLYNTTTNSIIKGSKWNLTTKGSYNQEINTYLYFDESRNCQIGGEFYIGNCLFYQGVYEIFGSRIVAQFNCVSHASLKDESYARFEGIVNGNAITGTYTGKYEYGSTDYFTGKITILGYTPVSQPFQCKRAY